MSINFMEYSDDRGVKSITYGCNRQGCVPNFYDITYQTQRGGHFNDLLKCRNPRSCPLRVSRSRRRCKRELLGRY